MHIALKISCFCLKKCHIKIINNIVLQIIIISGIKILYISGFIF